MKIIIIIFAFLLFVSGIVYSGSHNLNVFKLNKKQVLSEESEVKRVEENSQEDYEKIVGESHITKEKENSPTSQPSIQLTPQPTSVSLFGLPLNDFVYPGSEVVSSSAGSAYLRTMDDPDKVTDWYKEKIESYEMNVKSFVTTKTNDNVLNKLAGAKEGLEIAVEVKRGEGEFVSEINLTLSGD